MTEYLWIGGIITKKGFIDNRNNDEEQVDSGEINYPRDITAELTNL